MSFDVPADAYGRFMGRFSEPLAPQFADLAGVAAGMHALDVGCGPGALTAVLVDRLGPRAVHGIDPSEPFVAAARARFPDVDLRVGAAESLPYPDGAFDVTLAQLVVQFMAEPVAGLRDMARATRRGGTVAACVWDHAGGTGPLSEFWRAARDVDPAVPGEVGGAGAREGHLRTLAQEAGLAEVEQHRLQVRVRFDAFDDWWEPFTFGVGPAGRYVATRDDRQREAIRERCRDRLGDGFVVEAAAWAVIARR